MTEWGWVTFAYLVAYGGMTLYLATLHQRLRRARRRLEKEQ